MALGLYPELSQSLRALDSAVRGAATFDPAASTHRFRLMMTDLGLMALFPYIIRAVLAAAPNVGIDVIPLDTAQLHDRLCGMRSMPRSAFPQCMRTICSLSH